MTDPRFKIPKATLLYNAKGEPVDLLLDSRPIGAPISANSPISVDFECSADFQTITLTLFVTGFKTEVQQ